MAVRHDLGLRLGPKGEFLSKACCGTGDGRDSYPVWTGSAQAPTPASHPTPAPSPTPVPPPTPATQHMWAAITGPGALGGMGVESPNYPQNYGTEEAGTLEIDLGLAAPIAGGFDTESYHDYLTGNGRTTLALSAPAGSPRRLATQGKSRRS